MPDKLRLGLVGPGGWAHDFLVPAILSHPSAALTAVCGRTHERAEALAVTSGAEVYTDYVDMIDNAGLDAVVVATPEDLHHPVVMAALAARLHVLCEKPMAYSATQSGEMLEAADRAGVKHMVQFTNRGLPHFRYVKHLLDDGYIGQPYHASFSWATGWGPAAEVNPYYWPCDAQRSTGAAGELGAHLFDLARWYLGDVVRVSASLKTFVTHDGRDGQPMETSNDSAFALLDFANGAHTTVHVGLPNIVGPGLRQTGQVMVLSGSEGTLETRGDPWTKPSVSEIIGFRRGAGSAETLTIPASYDDGADPGDVFAVFRRQSIGPRLFIDAILEDRAITPSFADGHQVQRIVDAALVSDRTGASQVL
ncbi:MAG TPA: Gfo/Idh/MocA family oxidoreductase [Microlunatus sp.]